MPSTCTLSATVGLHVTVPHMPVSQLNGSWKQVLEKKVCLWYLRKKFVSFCSGRKRKVMFSCWKEKNNLIGKKSHTPPPGIKWFAPKTFSEWSRMTRKHCVWNFMTIVRELTEKLAKFIHHTGVWMWIRLIPPLNCHISQSGISKLR